MDIAYYPRSPALSTAHPDIWDGERLTDTVLGGAQSRLMPRFAAAWIARFLRGKGTRYTCVVRTLPDVRAPISLAWGVLGLRAWNASPAAATDWLSQSYSQYTGRRDVTTGLSLLVLAHGDDPLVSREPRS